MMVMDTHAWIWWVANPGRLPGRARSALDEAVDGGDVVSISAISAWEVAMLVSCGRLELTTDAESWIQASEALPFVRFVPVDNRIAVRAVHLESFDHRDPADRIIVATTQGLAAILVTGDARLHAYDGVRTLWD